MSLRIRGLVAAVHSPFAANGDLNLAIIERQAEHLVRDGAFGVFACGTTGECSSLTLVERMAIAERWFSVAQGTPLKVLIHVGASCLADSQALAVHAEQHGAAAVAALAPCYFKPKDVPTLVDSLALIAAAAPRTPFYFYDIPSLTNVTFAAPDVLALAITKIPNLQGVKFTNPDLFNYQRCLHLDGGRLDCPYGLDEAFLAAMAVGGSGAVGSGYNFTIPLYHKIMASLAEGDLPAARHHQFIAVELIAMLMSYTYLPASKVIMKCIGLDVGPTRLPLAPLASEQEKTLRVQWDMTADKIRG